ncbi:anchored repeat ABC transporter, substrate-binding protein [Corynebacterium sp.]|uniref:anchored repeat ABC transporter, substrate-binding protein n=1 Tax=Corynebacterium sp. TaxID=1720 RepID=UPI0039C88400
MISRRATPAALTGLLCAALASCSAAPVTPRSEVTSVVATTPILADLATNVAGDRARVTALMPAGADPHTYEPGLRAVREIANADLALTNGLLLEPASLSQTVATSTPADTPVVALAEEIPRHGVELIPLVENVALDAVWLGLRVESAQQGHGDPVELRLVGARGPGEIAAYVTTTFGTPEVLFNSADGFGGGDPQRPKDAALLPDGAHTHVSWAFSAPGAYELDIADDRGSTATVTVAVGIDPVSGTSISEPTVIDAGHVDITTSEDEISLLRDVEHGSRERLDPARTVVSVPGSTLQPIPADPAFRFLGRPGEETYLLPQAVLGRHVHGEVDPHVWHDVAAAVAMVQIIRDELVRVDPKGAADYRRNAEEYIAELEVTNAYVRRKIASIPAPHRYLVTTHHGYAYLGRAYRIKIAGFVTPNPSVEPTPRDVIALTRTLENLKVPAVFVEPQLAQQPNALTETAARLGTRVCSIRADTLDEGAPTYIEFMKHNADSLAACLA